MNKKSICPVDEHISCHFGKVALLDCLIGKQNYLQDLFDIEPVFFL